MKPRGNTAECKFATVFRSIIIVFLLTIIMSFVPMEVAKNIRQVKGPGQQSELKYIGQLRPRESKEIGGSKWGISCHWMVDKHDLTPGQQADQLARLGAKWGFLCPDWNRIETEKNKYDFNTSNHPLDDVVNAMVQRKIEPIIQIYGGNQLYMPVAMDPNNRQMAEAGLLLDDPVVRQAWYQYLEMLVKRYKVHVKVWEIWNEPNSKLFWQKDGKYFKTSVYDYGRVVKEAASIIRRIQPEAVVIAGSTANVPLDYLEGFLSSEGADYFDYWSVHPYCELPESRDVDIRCAKEILANHGKSTVMWQSECGLPSGKDTGGWGWGGPWNEKKHAKWVLRRLLSDVAMGMQTSIYFVLNDYPSLLEGGSDKGKIGINRKGLHFYGSWKPKPAAYAFQNLASIIDNRMEQEPYDLSLKITSFANSTLHENIRTYVLKEKTTGSPVITYWLVVPIETDFAINKIQISLPTAAIEEPVLVDLIDGSVYEVPTSNESQSVVYTKLPIADSPLVLCSRNTIELISDGKQ